jgi:CBS domain-containing protein
MTSPAIVAEEKATVREVARLMLDEGVSAVPILSDSGGPIGMASDGDLLGRRRDDARRAWWLGMLAEGSASDEALATQGGLAVRQVMSAPLISISSGAAVQDIAEALQAHRIKRLPVIDDGRLRGVVSRADLLCVVESIPRVRFEGEGGTGILGFLESLIGGASLRGGLERSSGAGETPGASQPQARELSAAAFRSNVRAYKAETFDRKQAARREAELDRRRQIKALLDHHVSGQLWRELIEHAELAARGGEQELMLLRFPSDLCSDGGRMIDVAEQGWEETLRGEAAEIYDRWRKELKPQGFGLSARIVSYDEGIIGDIGLYLTWGE